MEALTDRFGFRLQYDPFYESRNFLEPGRTAPFVIDYRVATTQWLSTRDGTHAFIWYLKRNAFARERFLAVFFMVMRNKVRRAEYRDLKRLYDAVAKETPTQSTVLLRN